jgi:hypothetical protein
MTNRATRSAAGPRVAGRAAAPGSGRDRRRDAGYVLKSGNGLDIAPPGLHPVKTAAAEWP